MMIALRAQDNIPRIIYGIDKASGKSYFIEQSIADPGVEADSSGGFVPPTYRLSGLRFNVTKDFKSDYLTPIQNSDGSLVSEMPSIQVLKAIVKLRSSRYHGIIKQLTRKSC